MSWRTVLSTIKLAWFEKSERTICHDKMVRGNPGINLVLWYKKINCFLLRNLSETSDQTQRLGHQLPFSWVAKVLTTLSLYMQPRTPKLYFYMLIQHQCQRSCCNLPSHCHTLSFPCCPLPQARNKHLCSHIVHLLGYFSARRTLPFGSPHSSQVLVPAHSNGQSEGRNE